MRKLRLLAMLVALFAFVGVQAQTASDYSKIRKQFKISKPTDIRTLDDFTGTKVIEVQGTVKGIVGSSESELLMFVSQEGTQLYIHSSNTPDWLRTGSIPARIIVEASRDTAQGLMTVQFVAACTETEGAVYEKKDSSANSASSPIKGRIGSKSPSRGAKSGRPAPMPGDVPNPKTNPIGQPREGITEEMAKVLPSYVEFIAKRNKKLTDDECRRIAESILAYSAHFGVDARLIVAIVITESDFDPKETSRAGAMGLGQLMPVNQKELGISDPYDIEQNLWGTVKLVRGHIDKYNAKTEDSFEALVLALAGYNAGDGAVKKYGGVPPYKETQNYVKKVISIYKELCGK